jgi:hypothetical protein
MSVVVRLVEEPDFGSAFGSPDFLQRVLSAPAAGDER